VKKLTKVKYALEQFPLTISQQKYQAQQQQTSQERIIPEQETMQTIVMGSENLCITQGMLQVDEAIVKIPLKDIYHMDLELPNIPTKVLYKLQISVAQEI
jgi:hypothetical protein